MNDEREILRCAYRDFNARNIDAVLSRMHPEVEWANGMEGGHVHGKDEVRAYWTRQLSTLDPHVEPFASSPTNTADLVVEVHQVVHDQKGNLLLDTTVYHTYQFRDGLIARMDIAHRKRKPAKTTEGSQFLSLSRKIACHWPMERLSGLYSSPGIGEPSRQARERRKKEQENVSHYPDPG